MYLINAMCAVFARDFCRQCEIFVNMEFGIMANILVKTFPGCPAGEELVAELKKYQEKEGFDLAVEKVPSADLAEEHGLFGSPTILVNGIEYQRGRRGTPGFY